MKNLRLIFPFITLSILAIGLSSCSLAEDVTPPPGYQEPTAAAQSVSSGPIAPSSAPDPSQGAVIYTEKCAPCHGNDGLGNGPQAAQLPNPAAPIGSPDLARQSKPTDWFNVITQGKFDQFMPSFGQSLTDQQRWDVLAYVYSLSSPEADVQQGSEIYQAQCASCHGLQGKGEGLQGAGGKPVDLSDPAWQASVASSDIFQTITAGEGQMPGFGDKLSEAQRWALASFVRTLGNQSQPLAAAGTPAPAAGPSSVQETPQPTAPGAAVINPQGTPLAGTPAAAVGAVGSISGQIKNGSGGTVPAGLQVTLHGYDSMQEALTQTTTAGPDGKYVFPRVEMPTSRVFMSSVSYKNTVFNSDIVPGQAGSQPTNLPITIYEPTTDASALVVDRMHVLFDFSTPGTVQIVQLDVISNTGNKAVVSAGPGKPILTFALPTGAANLQFQQGDLGGRYVATADGFGDTQSVPPGIDQGQILFTYSLPYNRKADISLPLTMPIKAAVVMVPKVGVQVQGPQLQDGGDQDVQGVTFHLYTAENLAAGSKLTLTLNGNPSSGQASLISGSSLTTLLIGLVVFALVIGLAILWLNRMQRRAPKTQMALAVAGAAEGGSEPDEQDTLVDAIIALDDLYQAGKLPEEAYRKRRAELKARLGETIK